MARHNTDLFKNLVTNPSLIPLKPSKIGATVLFVSGSNQVMLVVRSLKNAFILKMSF